MNEIMKSSTQESDDSNNIINYISVIRLFSIIHNLISDNILFFDEERPESSHSEGRQVDNKEIEDHEEREFEYSKNTLIL